MERRTFLHAAVAGGVAAALSGCATMVAVSVPLAEGRVRLRLADHPELRSPGGFLKLRTEGEGQLVYLLALEDGSYAALSPTCTHRGCTVDVEGRHLVCPCHGSTYSRLGEVVRGPAPRPLPRYPVRVESDEVLIIDMEAS